ncbi:hypothetical protein FQZ97_729190 [compost metagenome]
MKKERIKVSELLQAEFCAYLAHASEMKKAQAPKYLSDSNTRPLVLQASGRPHNSLIFLASSRTLAATDVLRSLTDDFPLQNSSTRLR